MADIGVHTGALSLSDVMACTGFGWARVYPAIQCEGRGTGKETGKGC